MNAEQPVRDVQLFEVTTERITGSSSSHVVLRLETVDGVVGWGELSDLDCYRMFMPDRRGLEEGVRRMTIGYSATNLTALRVRLRSALPDFEYCARTYPPFSLASQIAAAIEMACLDIAGKAAGQTLGELLGGAIRSSIPVAFPLFIPGPTPSADPSARFASVEEALRLGISVFRFYVGTDVAMSLTYLQDLAALYGDRITLKGLDFGGRFHWKSVVRFVRALEDWAVPLVESASWREDYDGMAELRRAIDADVCEHVSSTVQLLRMIRANAIDVANVTIQSGGVMAARRLFETADGAGIRCLLGTTQELSLGTSAGAHLAASLPDLAHPADIVGPLLYRADIAVNPVRFEAGQLVVPTGPGLGVDVDEARLASLYGPLIDWDNPAHGPDYVAR